MHTKYDLDALGFILVDLHILGALLDPDQQIESETIDKENIL
jgi:hypothetical protein